MTKINISKKDMVSLAVSSVGGASAGFAAYVAALVPIMMAERGGTNKGLMGIARLGALIGGALVGRAASEQLMDITDDFLENGITLGIKKVTISRDGAELDIDK